MRARALAWTCGVAVALAVTAAGCTAEAVAPLAPTATVEFPRTLQADRMVEVHVTSTGGADVRVTSATLESGYFAPAAATEREVRVWEGHEARVRVALGDPTCPAEEGAGDDARVALSVSADGVEAAQAIAVPTEMLAEINAAECAARDAVEVAVPALGAPGAVADGALATTLVLDRAQANAPVTVTAVAGSVIFAVDTEPGVLPVTLASHEQSLAVPVSIRVARCDPHAFAESKKTFLFKVWLEVGAAEETYVEMYAAGALRDALQDLFDACGEEARSAR